MCPLLTRLLRRTARPSHRPRPRRPVLDLGANPTGGTPPPEDDDRPCGCGWFDSSHDLLSGVVVWEGIMVVDNTLTSPP